MVQGQLRNRDSDIVEEQIDPFDDIKNAEKLTQRKWGTHLVSIWDVPGTEPGIEPEEGTPWLFLGKDKTSELKGASE